MPTLYVARSRTVQEWGADVGLTEHVYKVGVTDEPVDTVIAALNADGFAGAGDWALVKSAETAKTEVEVMERLARKEKPVDPTHYPRLRGGTGLLKVKLANVQGRMLVQKMMAGEDEKPAKKPKPADIADYLLQDALA